MAGFRQGLGFFHDHGEIRWTNTVTNLASGIVHGYRYKVEKNPEDGAPAIALQHWVHWPSGQAPAAEARKHNPHILTIRTENRVDEYGRTQIRPVAAVWMGKNYEDPEDITRFLHVMQEMAGEIRENILSNVTRRTAPAAAFGARARVSQTQQRDEIPNLHYISQLCGVKAPALEGMNDNGEFRWYPSRSAPGKAAPVYPAQLLRPMLALEYDIVKRGDKEPFSHTYTARSPDGTGFDGASCQYEPVENGFEVSCRVWTTAKGNKQEAVLYRVRFAEEAGEENSRSFRLADMEMLGHKPDIRNHKGVARALRAMKYIHMAIQRSEAPHFADILHENDLKFFISGPRPPAEGPRTMIQVFGANTDALFSEKEKGIGSNGMLFVRDFVEDGEWVKLGIGVDWGITFGDGRKEFAHSTMHNFGRYVRHPSMSDLNRFVETFINFETHEHEDHLRGIARLAKFGYDLPPLVMNTHSKRVLKRMMQEERVPKAFREDLLERCHIIDMDDWRDMTKEEAESVCSYAYGNTVIEQGTEAIWSEEEQRTKYFPYLQVYDKSHPEHKIPVRVGPAGHSAYALMFEIGGVLYTGDYKLDQTIPAAVRTDLDWLRRCRDTAAVHVMETTNAGRSNEDNPTQDEIRGNLRKIFLHERRHRIFYDLIGSNAINMKLCCEAIGEARDEAAAKGEPPPFKYIIFAGSSVLKKYGDLNFTDGLSAMMEERYNIKTLRITSPKAQELLSGQNNDGSYVVIHTGTQDEEMSISHRISRDLHDLIFLKPGDVMIRAQTPIPVGGNFRRRIEQNNRLRFDFECKVYDAVDMANDGFHIYASSHASRADARKIHRETGDLQKVLHHGGPHQLASMELLMAEEKARAIVPDKQVFYKVDHAGRTLSVAGETPEERVAFREIRRDPREFFSKHRQEALLSRVKDRWSGPVAAVMYEFLNSQERKEKERLKPTALSRGANLTDAFQAAADDTGAFPPLGIYHPSVSRPYHDAKNIKVLVMMDTETTGVDPVTDVHTDASFVAIDHEGKTLGSRTLKHGIPAYKTPALGALAVTRNDNPWDLHKGMPLREYVYELNRLYQTWPQELTQDKDARALWCGWRNTEFDDLMTMRMMGTALAAVNMKPMSTFGNLSMDLYHVYSAYLALHPDKIGGEKDDKGNYIKKLGAACRSNGIEYDPDKAHGSLYDAERLVPLIEKFKAVDPELFEQMIINSDFSTRRPSPMIDQILGIGQDINGQNPVFGYVDPRDYTCRPRLGALVTIDKETNGAIVLDLARGDPQQLALMSDEELIALMKSPENPFSHIKLGRTPCLFPPQMVWNSPGVRSRAVQTLPRATLLARARALREIGHGGVDMQHSLKWRIFRLYPHMKRGNAEWWKNKKAPVDESFPRSVALPGQKIGALADILNPNNSVSSRHYKAAAKLIRDLQPKAEEFEKGFDKKAYWASALQRIDDIAEAAGDDDKMINDLRFLIQWQAHDVNPRLLSAVDRTVIEAHKAVMVHGPDNPTFTTLSRFVRELVELEENPEERRRLLGEGEEAERAWQTMKESFTRYARDLSESKRFELNEKRRAALRERRRQGRDFSV